MKNIFLTLLMVVGLSSNVNANTVELLPIENQEIVVTETFEKVVDKKIMLPGLGLFLAQVSYCAQVQMDVKETYTSVFGPDRANSIALGAFMGCMGYL